MSQYDEIIVQLKQRLIELQQEYREVNDAFQKTTSITIRDKLGKELKQIYLDIESTRRNLDTYIALREEEKRPPEPEPEQLPADYYDKLYKDMSVEDLFAIFYGQGK